MAYVKAESKEKRTYIENCLLVWLNQNIEEDLGKYPEEIFRLKDVFARMNTFDDSKKCLDFISNVKNNERIFLISSGTLGKNVVPQLHDMAQVDSIYIFCGDKSKHEEWVKSFWKIKGLFTSMKLVIEALENNAKKLIDRVYSMGFASTSEDITSKSLNQFDQCFVCGQVLKEIFQSIHFKKDDVKEFLSYYTKTPGDSENAAELIKKYEESKAVKLYLRLPSLFSMINNAFDHFNLECMMKIAVFLRDLHQNINDLYTKQNAQQWNSNSFVIFRGQSLSMADFHRLQRTPGGLISFTNFLLANRDRDVSLDGVREEVTKDSELMGVLFVIKIDSSISSTPYADVREITRKKQVGDLLFSMHSIFRITTIQNLEGNNRLWEVQMTLIDNKDPELRLLTEFIQTETDPHIQGWYRLGNSLMKLQNFDRAQRVYDLILNEQINLENAEIYRKLGMIKEQQQEYHKAVSYYKISLEIHRDILPATHSNLAYSYILLGEMYIKVKASREAITTFEKALDIQQKILPPNHIDLARSYQRLGNAYYQWSDNVKAISFYEKALEIYQRILPENHLDLATMNYNIGIAYNKMNQFSKALSWLESAVKIGVLSLSSEDPILQKWQTTLESAKKSCSK